MSVCLSVCLSLSLSLSLSASLFHLVRNPLALTAHGTVLGRLFRDRKVQSSLFRCVISPLRFSLLSFFESKKTKHSKALKYIEKEEQKHRLRERAACLGRCKLRFVRQQTAHSVPEPTAAYSKV